MGKLDRVAQVRAERQPCADLGNGYYRNPIIAGNYADPSVVRVGADYYICLLYTSSGDTGTKTLRLIP